MRLVGQVGAGADCESGTKVAARLERKVAASEANYRWL